MDEERTPLLQNGTGDNAANNGLNNGDESSSSGFNSPTLQSYHIPIYGTYEPPTRMIPHNERIKYSWSDLNVFIKNSERPEKSCWKFFSKSKAAYVSCLERKHILKNINGVAYPGELLAILGSSGAGKTTLLNTLTFRSGSDLLVSGVRCVNGTPITPKSLISQSAYVQQDDLFIGNLTVREHLIFQALVRMDRKFSYAQRIQRVDEVITELSLKKCEYTRIGVIGRTKGISGGERKRLAFASEVLTDPHLMFCDEPTSGLDSFMALNVVQVLKNMAQSGKTVICTIHQPSSEIYALFDKILLMAEGRIAFTGSPEEADLFFKQLEAPCPKNYNPADYFIQVLAVVPEKEESCKQAITLISDKFEKSEYGVKIALEAAPIAQSSAYNDGILNGSVDINNKRLYKVSWWAQFRAVLWRSWLTVIKEPLLIKVRFLQTIIVAFVIGFIYFGQQLDQDGVMNINGVLFIFLTTMTFQNVFAVVNVFCSEIDLFLREHRNGMYRTDVYFICKTIAETPVFIIIPILFISVCYFMIGLNSEEPRFFIACGILILVSNVTISFGYLISCAASSVSMALSIGPPLIIPFLLFGGFFLNINSVPIYFQWLSYISWFRYGNEALMINQWGNVPEIDCPSGNSTCPKSGHVVLEIFNFSEEHFLQDIVWLVGLLLGFRLLAYLMLLLKTYRK